MKSHAPKSMEPSLGRDLCDGVGSRVHSADAEILSGKSFCGDSGGKSLKSSEGDGVEGCLTSYFKVIIFRSLLEKQLDVASKPG